MSQLVQAPASSHHTKIEELGYVESYDAVIDKDYALVAYAETKTATGKTVVKVKSLNTAGSAFDAGHDAFRKALRAAMVRGEEYLIWGFRFNTSENDPRVVENHVFGDEQGNPSALELHLVTRKIDGSAAEPKVVRVDWPK